MVHMAQSRGTRKRVDGESGEAEGSSPDELSARERLLQVSNSSVFLVFTFRQTMAVTLED